MATTCHQEDFRFRPGRGSETLSRAAQVLPYNEALSCNRPSLRAKQAVKACFDNHIVEGCPRYSAQHPEEIASQLTHQDRDGCDQEVQILGEVFPSPGLSTSEKMLIGELEGHGKEGKQPGCQAELPDLVGKLVQLLLQCCFFPTNQYKDQTEGSMMLRNKEGISEYGTGAPHLLPSAHVNAIIPETSSRSSCHLHMTWITATCTRSQPLSLPLLLCKRLFNPWLLALSMDS